MQKKISRIALWVGLVFSTWAATPARAVDGVYLGGHFGQVVLGGGASTTFRNAVGFGGDVGVRVNPVLDVILRGQVSNHPVQLTGTNLSLAAVTLSPEFRFLEISDFEVSAGIGPGFYFFNSSTSANLFGVQGGVNGDVAINGLRLGLGWRYHAVLGTGPREGSYWTLMARVGLVLEVGS